LKEFSTVSLSPILGVASQALSLFGGASAKPAPPSASSGSVDLSEAAQLFSKLQDLSQTNPTQFKQLTAQISSQLQTAAQSATGSAQSFLSNLSTEFNSASQTGNTAALHPAQNAGGGHGHHRHHSDSTASAAQAAYQQASQSADSSSSVASVLQTIYREVESA
jgi:hypothetical protein